jgi:hypothetical protein
MMNPDNQLLVGAVLIGIGLLLALLAYFVFSSRGDEESPDEEDEAPEETPAEPVSEAPSVADIPATNGAAVDAGVVPSMQKIEESREPPAPAPVEEEAPEPSASPAAARIPVATLLRDDVTGDLIVRVGETEYHSVRELSDSRDWTRVKYAAADLARWFPEARPVEKPRPAESEESTHAPSPHSMVEQINQILQKKLVDSGQETKAVRLIEGPGGAVRVLIGVNSYGLEDVPDEEVSNLIREAVAAWEDRQ